MAQEVREVSLHVLSEVVPLVLSTKFRITVNFTELTFQGAQESEMMTLKDGHEADAVADQEGPVQHLDPGKQS